MSKIEIVDHKEEWKNEFISLAEDIRANVGDLALRIDHIGSTAIMVLPAKDVIDVQVTVSKIVGNSIVKKLIDAGYVFRSDIIHDNLVGVNNSSPELQKLYFREKAGCREVHIHIREVERANQIYALVFRDFLRCNLQVREAYAAIKKELSIHFSQDDISYYAIKDPFMDTIYVAAKLWSVQCKWRPDREFK